MKGKTLVTFHGNQSEKDAVLVRLQMHHDADEIVKGVYWENGKGCAVGCTIHSDNHAEYETLFGIPQSIAYLEDRLFEGLPEERAKEWPLQFMRAIPVGADLSRVKWLFLHRILTDESITPGTGHPIVRDAVATVAHLCSRWAKGEPIDESAAESAESAAKSAWSAAESAWSAWGGWNAARSAARSAWNAAGAAWNAEGAAWSAESATACSAWSAVRSAAYVKMADVLLDLLATAPQAMKAA